MEPRGKATVEAEIAECMGQLRDLRRELGRIKQRERYATEEARREHAAKVRAGVLAKSPRTLPSMTKKERGKYEYLRRDMGRARALAVVVPGGAHA